MLIVSVLIKSVYSCLQGHCIALGSQSADDSFGNVRKIGVMAKRFASVHIGKMHFDEWDAHRQQCVTYCDTGVGKCSGIYDDEINCFVAGGMNAPDQFVFGIALQRLQLMTIALGLFKQAGVDLSQSHGAVDAGFAAA